jgi:nitrate reductase delta subunit
MVAVGSETANRRVLQLFADILDYPQQNIVQHVRECETLVSATSSEAAVLLRQFRRFLEETPNGQLEEVYTGIFDLDAACHPYVGYQLFGESYERSAFIVELKKRYRSSGFEASESELPDRLSVLLRFLSMSGDGDPNQEIINEGILPALDKMAKEAKEAEEAEEADGQLPPHGSNPYRQVLEALRLVLERLQSVTVPAPGASSEGDGSNV